MTLKSNAEELALIAQEIGGDAIWGHCSVLRRTCYENPGGCDARCAESARRRPRDDADLVARDSIVQILYYPPTVHEPDDPYTPVLKALPPPDPTTTPEGGSPGQ